MKINCFILFMFSSLFAFSQTNNITEIYKSKKIDKSYNNPFYRILFIFTDLSFRASQNNYYLYLMNDSSFTLILKDIRIPQHKKFYYKEIGKYTVINDSFILISNSKTPFLMFNPSILTKRNKNTLIFTNKTNKRILVFHRKKISNKILLIINKIDSLVGNNPSRN